MWEQWKIILSKSKDGKSGWKKRHVRALDKCFNMSWCASNNLSKWWIYIGRDYLRIVSQDMPSNPSSLGKLEGDACIKHCSTTCKLCPFPFVDVDKNLRNQITNFYVKNLGNWHYIYVKRFICLGSFAMSVPRMQCSLTVIYEKVSRYEIP